MASETVDETNDQAERDRIVAECSHELDGLGAALEELLPPGNALEPMDYATRVLVARIRELACIVMSASCDPLDSNASLRERLTGERQEEVAHV